MKVRATISGGPILQSRSVAYAGASLLALVLVACDPGYPPAAEQMANLGLPVDSAMQVDEETVVIVRLASGTPELLIYTPNPFGGDEVKAWPADDGTIGDGAIGTGTSLPPFDEQRREYPFFYCYLFGAGQGPIGDILLSNPAARWQITNPEIDGWVVVMSNDEDVKAFEWDLIGADGRIIHAGRGFPGNYTCGAGG
jgi:hypothetical protein